MKGDIFISYSRYDIEAVSQIVELLRATREDLVFQDSTSIKPAQKWEQKIEEAVDKSNLFILFWCGHSSTSYAVIREYNRALEKDKNILPVLLDDTPLKPALATYQALDFRKTIRHQDFDLLVNKPKANLPLPIIPILILLFLIVMTIIFRQDIFPFFKRYVWLIAGVLSISVAGYFARRLVLKKSVVANRKIIISRREIQVVVSKEDIKELITELNRRIPTDTKTPGR